LGQFGSSKASKEEKVYSSRGSEREPNLLIALGIYFHFYAPTDLFYISTHQGEEGRETEGKLNNGDLLCSFPFQQQQQPHHISCRVSRPSH
jgi:hypothetical protein